MAGDGDERVPFHGLTITENTTRVFRDDKGRLRIKGIVIAEPRNADELPDGPGTLGTVESLNDDGTVTVDVGGHRADDTPAAADGGGDGDSQREDNRDDM